LAGASWSFDRASTNLKEFCGLSVCDTTLRSTCDEHGSAMRDWQREAPNSGEPFRKVDGDVEFQTDGTCVNTTRGWREMRLSIFAKRKRGKPTQGSGDWEQRNLPAPHVRMIQAAIRTGDQLGSGWRRLASRLGVANTSQLSVIADGAKWIWKEVSPHPPGCFGVPDIYHASEHLWAAANTQFGEATAKARSWANARRMSLLERGCGGPIARVDRRAVVGIAWLLVLPAVELGAPRGS
jgi:hypothetical protein